MPGVDLIWDSKAPTKCKCLLWLAIRNRCWTADRLRRRGLDHPQWCPLCDQEQESISHLLLDCVMARIVWFVCFWYGTNSNGSRRRTAQLPGGGLGCRLRGSSGKIWLPQPRSRLVHLEAKTRLSSIGRPRPPTRSFRRSIPKAHAGDLQGSLEVLCSVYLVIA